MAQQTTEHDPSKDDKNNDDDMVWYFAIGSMMHPSQCQNRDFKPIKSQPAKLLGYELGFFSKFGVAEAIPKPDASMHGVLHYVTQAQMVHLDKIERGYIRKEGIAIPYGSKEDGEESPVTATVYCRDEKAIKKNFGGKINGEHEEVIPTQRYIELLAEGAKYWNVDQDYIDMIRNRKVRPRKDPADFKVVEPPPDSPSYDEIPEDTPEKVHFTLNGKVVCYTYPENNPMHHMVKGWKNDPNRSVHMEINYAKMLYDTKYGAPSTLSEFTKEHTGYLEDLAWEFSSAMGNDQYLKVIGTYTAQTWIES